ncbi:N-acetylmuramoyl-L-alanine amidase [Actinoplanes sp. NBRC 101535]|uniref:N-acetylmuramoyl-L-alanine amidase n=1 Tax=Actinoplanes sp. NBRC 101535 TaxID=3032196 RepID=UPI0024A15375|nr:N-acetylmuramoyl-L-alanine amidase [Actinoplanes sp. NBRC 101535]GLY00270.1 hypothetical protein Acsp01_06490 [Actinoplanes sp. NBRC 101535]
MHKRVTIGLGTAVAVLAAGGGVAMWPTAAPPAAAPALAVERTQPAVVPVAATTAAAPATTTTATARTPAGTSATTAPPAAKSRLRTLAVPERTAKKDLAQRATERFSLLGVTWSDPDDAPTGDIEVRTRSVATGEWTGWQPLEAADTGPDAAEAANPGRRGATEPLWVGPSDGVAARFAGGGELPSGLRLDLIDPGTSTGGQGGGEAEIGTSNVVTPPFPAYVSRTAWGADEKITGDVTIGTEVKVFWVHHTATTNDYTCAESAAIVRSIQTYDVTSKKLSDIGYNYLVDKCGTLFEGRKGGVQNAVVGAHTVGFNTGYAAVSVIGDYETATSNSAVEAKIAQLAANRLGTYGYDPTSTVTISPGVANDKYQTTDQLTVERLAGHRDADATLCPGANLYSRLPAIRVLTQQTVLGLALTSVTGGGSAGGAYYVKNRATLAWKLITPSADLARFDILVDGTVAGTVANTVRSASVAVPPGRHTVAVRGVSATTGSATVNATVHGDVTAPVFGKAVEVGLRTGTYSAAAVPVKASFTAKDNLKLTGLTVSKPKAATLGVTATSWSPSVKTGAVTYTVTARDLSGNTRASSASRTVVLSAETAAKRTGAWTKVTGKSHLGGKALSAKVKNRKLTWTFTGRSAALLFSRTAKSGKAAIYVDGKKITTVDLKASKTSYRQAVWTRDLKPGKHTVAVVVQATAGRPTVISDGLAYIR